MIKRFVMVLLVVILLSVLGGPGMIQAQQGGLIHVCVAPPNANEYLLTFRATTLFGLIVPQQATITVYADRGDISAGVYAINPDAMSGSYVRTEFLVHAETAINVPTGRACTTGYADVLTSQLATVPIPVSKDHALIVQIGGIDQLNNVVLGAFSLHFRIGSEAPTFLNFQILQLSDTDTGIEVYVPFVPGNTPLTVIGNKDFAIRQSFADNDQAFSPSAPAANREFLSQQLAYDSLNMYVMMREAAVRIYPHRGIETSYLGGYVRLEMAPIAEPRDPQFTEGATITPLGGAPAVPYYVTSNQNEPLGVVQPGGTVQVSRIDVGTGTLYIERPDDDGDVIIEAWLMEVVE